MTIIDDDKPGSIAFEDSKPIKAIASNGKAEINIIRKNGSDGKVTEQIQLETLEKFNIGKLPIMIGDFMKSNIS